jgi:hypothetical protein
MTKIKFSTVIFLLVFVIQTALPIAYGHDLHFTVGAAHAPGADEPEPGEPLAFVDLAPLGRTFHLLARPVGQRCGGYYSLDESVRSLHKLDAFAINVQSNGTYEIAGSKHPHTGSWIWAEIVSVSGPDGATFGFWEENSNVVTHSMVTNQPTGNPRFVLSEGIDDVMEDPQGHIHGRAWTADKAGDYQIGIRLIDLSTTAAGGGPWHAPSQVYVFHFSTGPAFQPVIARNPAGAVTLTWPSEMGIDQEGGQSGVVFTVLRSPNLSEGTWESVGTVTGTIADTVSFVDPSPPPGAMFYRLTYPWRPQ